MIRRAAPRAALLLLAVTACRGSDVTLQAAARVVPTPVRVAPTSTPPGLPSGCSPRAEACVSTEHRLAWLQREGRLVLGTVRIAIGTPSHPTPHGTFHVAWKDEEHTSSLYGVDMPYSVFFAAGGIAFHQGPLDEPSHGCVHLTAVAASAFFAALQPGDRVEVF